MRWMLCWSMLIAVAGAKSPANSVLVIRLVNAEVIPPRALRQAEQSAAAIFARARVAVDWVDCAEQPCAVVAGPWIQFIDGCPGPRADTAGYAVLYPAGGGSAGYAVVGWRKVQAAAATEGFDPGPVLGAAIAHEIGHLLLGKGSHSHGGVMIPRLRRREMAMAERGELGFSDEQSRLLIAAVRARY